MAFPMRGLQLPNYPLSRKYFISGRCESMLARASSSIHLHGAEPRYRTTAAFWDNSEKPTPKKDTHKLDQNPVVWVAPPYIICKSSLFKVFRYLDEFCTTESVLLQVSGFLPLFQCSLTHHTALLPADISQKPLFTLWIQHSLPLWSAIVQRCSCMVRQRCTAFKIFLGLFLHLIRI